MHTGSGLLQAGRKLDFVFVVLVVALVGYYLFTWRNTPLYPDEIALRLQSARFLADGALVYTAFPQCNTVGIPIQWPLILPAYLISLWDFILGWTFVRLGPALIVLLAIGVAAFLTRRNGSPTAAGLLPFAFLGVSGCGLIMMRMECFLILQALIYTVSYALLRLKRSLPFELSWMVLLAISTLVSIFVHPQGLILIPFGLLATIAMAMTSQSMAARAGWSLVLVWLCVASWDVAGKIQLNCEGAPEIAQAIQNRTIMGNNSPTSPLFAIVADRVNAYARNFSFNSTYPSNHLPGYPAQMLQKQSVKCINFVIKLLTITTLLTTVVFTFFAVYRALKCTLFNRAPLQLRLDSMITEASVYFSIVAVPHLLYFAYDVEGNFYRAYYFNFVFCLLNVIAISGIRWIQQYLLLLPASVSIVLLLSTTANNEFFNLEFSKAWVGPSLDVNTNWNKADKLTGEVSKVCGIDGEAAGIVVDDLTFSALKHHRHLIPFTYASQGDSFMAEPLDTASFLGRLSRYSSAVVVKCDDFTNGIPEGIVREGGLCCVRF